MAKKEKHSKPKYSLGIDIGTYSIKAVYIRNTDKEPVLMGFGENIINSGQEYAPNDFSFGHAVPAIRKTLSDMGLKAKNIKHLVTSLTGQKVSVKQIKSAYLPEEELESSLYFEAKKHLPVGGSKLLLDYQIVKEHEKDNSLDILIAVTTEGYMNEYIEMIKNSGLNPGIIDSDALALANSFIIPNFYTYEEGGIYVFINIGGSQTNFVAVGKDNLFFYRNISIGGLHLTNDIMKNKNMDYEAAESYKREHGIFNQEEVKKDAGTLSTASLGFKEKGKQEALVDEIRRTLRYYVKEGGNSDFRKVLLTGGSSNIKGFDEYLQSQINLPVEIYNPMDLMERDSKINTFGSPQYAIACGLALRDY